MLNLAFQRPRHPPHPEDHRHQQRRRQQQEKPFHGLLVPGELLEQHGAQQAGQSRGADSQPDRAGQVAPADLAQVGQADAHHQGGFDAFAQRDEQGREHGLAGCNLLQFSCN